MNYTHWIDKEGFTTKLTSYYYLLPLNPKNATLAALLARVLERGSEDYPTVEAIHSRGDELYGATAYFDVNIFGSFLVFEATLLIPQYAFFDQPQLEEEAREYFHSLLYRPLLRGGEFLEEFFLQEQQMLDQDLEAYLKDPESYALRRSMELLFSGSPLGIYRYGDRKTLGEVDVHRMGMFYQELLKAPLYIYHHGDEKREDEGEKLFFDGVEEEANPLEKTWEERRDIAQSILVQAYRMPWSYRDEKAYHALVLNHLLGGAGTSYLFRKTREEEGLCYSIYSRYDRFRKLILIVSGHEKDQHEDLLKSIDEVLDILRSGTFSCEELEEIKLDLSIGIASLSDSQSRHVKDSFIRDLFGEEKEVEKRVEKIQKVTREDVISLAKDLSCALSFYVRQE